MKPVDAFLIFFVCVLGLVWLHGSGLELSQPADPETVIKDPEEPIGTAPGAAPGGSWTDSIYPAKAGDSSGTAVAVGSDTLYTAKHICGQYTAIWVKVRGEWVKAQVTRIPGDYDGAKLQVSGVSLNHLRVRPARYGEPVYVYGLKSSRRQHGVISSNATVSLDAGESGTDFGDSGGAVVSEDGSLVGIVTGYESEHQDMRTPANPRVVFFVRSEMFERAPASSVATPLPAQQDCPDGSCTITLPFSFRRSR